MGLTVEVRIPSDERVTWTPERAATAIGKPMLDAPIDGKVIGEVTTAEVVDDALVMTIDIRDGAMVGFDLEDQEVRCVSFGPHVPTVRS